MKTMGRFRRRTAAVALAFVAAATLAACADKMKKDEEEAAKNSIVCKYNGERLVIRFDAGEARMLFGTDRVSLYQIPTGSGIRYSNGLMELRGKDMDLQLVRDGIATKLADCGPYVVPK